MNAKLIKHASKSRTNIEKLHRINDATINYSDNPATDEAFWEDAEIFMPAHKIHLSLRLDEDIVQFFKDKGRGYQTKINAVLRSYLKAHRQHRKASGE